MTDWIRNTSFALAAGALALAAGGSGAKAQEIYLGAGYGGWYGPQSSTGLRTGAVQVPPHRNVMRYRYRQPRVVYRTAPLGYEVYGYAPGPFVHGYYGHRGYGWVGPQSSTGLRSGANRVSPHYNRW